MANNFLSGPFRRYFYILFFGYFLLIFFFWVDEYIDIISYFFGTPKTPFNWPEAVMETVVVLLILLFSIIIMKVHTEVDLARQTEIGHLNHLLSAIRDINRLIISEDDQDHLLNEVVRSLTCKGGYNTAWITLWNDDDSFSELYASGYTVSAEDLQKTFRSNIPECVKKIQFSDETTLIERPEKTCPVCINLSRVNRPKIPQICLAAPLKSRKRNFGILAATIPENFQRHDDEISLFKELASDISLALQGISEEKALIEVKDHLCDINRKLTETTRNLQISEEKYRTLFHHSADAIIVHEIDVFPFSGDILEANEMACKILGLSRDELLHRKIQSVFSRTDPFDPNSGLISENHNRAGIYEGKLQTHNGKELEVEVHITELPLRDQPALVSIYRDISERNENERRLKTYEYAIQASLNGIIITDLDGIIFFINEAMLRISGYDTYSDLIGKDIRTFIEDKKSAQDIITHVLEKECWSGEVTGIRKDNANIFLQISAVKVRNAADESVALMASVLDISCEKQLKERQAEALSQIEKNIEQLTILNDHIRNPLTIIISLADMVDNPLTDQIITQAYIIDKIITELDKGWIESDKIREYLKKHHGFPVNNYQCKNECSLCDIENTHKGTSDSK